MSDIAQILEKYKSMSSNALLTDVDQITRDIKFIGEHMPDLNEKQQYDAKTFLSGVLVHVDKMIDDVAGQLDGQVVNMDKVQKMSDACLAYLKPRTGKRKD
jgi:hypothetical protein